MEIKTLKGTSWYFNDKISLPNEFSYNINFVREMSNTVYNKIECYTNKNVKQLRYWSKSYGDIKAYYKASYPPYGMVWNNKHIRAISITGGEDAENQQLISWIQENSNPYTPLYKTWHVAITETANAIREKTGESSEIAWKEEYGFRDAIRNIPKGTDTTGGTASASDIVFGKIAYSNGNELTGTMKNASGVMF